MKTARRPKAKLIVLLVIFSLLLLIPVGLFTRSALGLPEATGGVASEGEPAPGKASAATPYPIGELTGGAYPAPETAMSAPPAGFPSGAYPGPQMTTPVPWYVKALTDYEEIMKQDNLSAERRRSLQTKIAMYSRIATEVARSIERAKTRTPVPHHPTRRPGPTSTKPVGLREGGSSTFHSWEAVIQNHWSQYFDNLERITVYAGELGSETKYPGRGVVYVLRIAPDNRTATFNEYLLPEGTGWVRISEIQEYTLVLTSKDGATFYFDAQAQQFVSSLTDRAPTVTPIPTKEPRKTPGPYP